MTWEIAEPRSVNDLILRPADLAEVAGMQMKTSKALWRSWQKSIYRRAVYVDGVLSGAWGVGGPFGSQEGYPWLLTGAGIERIPVTFLRQGRAEVARMLDLFPRLSGFVAADYTKALRFLGVLGFHIETAPVIVPATGARLFNYWMER